MVVRVEHQFFGKRLALAKLVAMGFMALLIARLWYLQGVYGGFYRDLSENNRLRTVRTYAARGMITDREGRTIVSSRPSFNVEMIPEDVKDVPGTLAVLAEVTGRNLAELKENLQITQRARHHFEPKVVISDIPRDQLARVKAFGYRLPGVIVDVMPTRFYPFSSFGAQAFGYSREITPRQLERYKLSNYRSGDIVGQSGIEQVWERYLRGQNGYRQVEVDAMGNRQRELGIVPDLPGKDLELTLDMDLQQIAEQELIGKRGAIVVLDPNTGGVLAIASAPSFDVNIFSRQMLDRDWQLLTGDRSRPLNNRAVSEVYPAGSTFKLVTSVAALAEKKLTATTELNCPGYYFFAGRRYHCHKRTGHGVLNLKRALTVSCNSFYFQVGQMLGIDLIHKYATMLGLGAPTGIDLPNEESGIAPSEEWKVAKYGTKWYPGDTLPVSIGQGYLVVTPIQMALMASVIANGGTLYTPHLVQKLTDPITRLEIEIGPGKMMLNRESGELEAAPPPRKLDIPDSVFAQVREIASSVVNDPHGTGKAAKFDQITVAGKTGTAQVSALGRDVKEELKDHAWFVSFGPVEKPLLSMAIIVENGGHGGTTSAPIAKKLYERYFRKVGLLKDEPVVVNTVDSSGPPAQEVEEGMQGSSSEDEDVAQQHNTPESSESTTDRSRVNSQKPGTAQRAGQSALPTHGTSGSLAERGDVTQN